MQDVIEQDMMLLDSRTKELIKEYLSLIHISEPTRH